MRESEKDETSVVLSVRFPAEMLERGKAVAEITSISFNELVRNAAERLLQTKAHDPVFAAKADAHIANALNDVRVAFGGEIPPEIIAALGSAQTPAT